MTSKVTSAKRAFFCHVFDAFYSLAAHKLSFIQELFSTVVVSLTDSHEDDACGHVPPADCPRATYLHLRRKRLVLTLSLNLQWYRQAEA